MKQLLCIACLLFAACGPESPTGQHDLSAFDDGLSLKLCDSEGRCQNPGQLVLFVGRAWATDEHQSVVDRARDPFHWIAQDVGDVNDPATTALVRGLFEEAAGTFEVRCDKAAGGVFMCGARQLSDRQAQPAGDGEENDDPEQETP